MRRLPGPEAISRLDTRAQAAGSRMTLYRYPEATHFYTDETLSDFAAAAASLTLTRVLDFLGTLSK